MTSWVAIAYGALDMRGCYESRNECEIVLLPVFPVDEPIGLAGAAAELWRRLVEGPVPDVALTAEEQHLVREFADFGLASVSDGHTARVTRLAPPWFLSPLHELVYALVASVARDNGIVGLFIKGPVLHQQGLRERKHSGDVDLWVDPGRIEELASALIEWGWDRERNRWDGISAYHSITMNPARWGAQVDLHRSMPGCADTHERVFDVLVENSTMQMFASVNTRVPPPPLHAVISALHDSRPLPGERPRPQRRDAAARTLQLGGAGVKEAAELLRASAALKPVLELAFPTDSFSVGYAVPKDWAWREQRSWVSSQLMLLSLIPVRERMLYIKRLIFPARADLLERDRLLGGDGKGVIRAQARRIRRALSRGVR